MDELQKIKYWIIDIWEDFTYWLSYIEWDKIIFFRLFPIIIILLIMLVCYVGVIGPLFFNKCGEPLLGQVIDKSFTAATRSTTNGIVVDGDGNPNVVIVSSGSSEKREMVILGNNGNIFSISTSLQDFYSYDIGDTIKYTECTFGEQIYK